MSLTPESLQGNEWVYAQISQDPILHAFDERKIADPRFDLPKTIIPGDELEWTEVLKNQSSGRQATYVHVPFCLTRCSFCRFFQNFSHDTKVVDTYAHLLAREIQFTAEASENIKPIEAMYFCGGTPTTLSPDNIKLVLNSLRSNLPFRDDAEISDKELIVCVGHGFYMRIFALLTIIGREEVISRMLSSALNMKMEKLNYASFILKEGRWTIETWNGSIEAVSS